MANYLNKILLSFLIIMMPHMNLASKAMDGEDDKGTTVRTHKLSFMTEDQKDISSSVGQSISSINLEDTQTSWTSCFLSRAKSVIKSTSQIINFATQSPQKAVFVGLCLAYQVAEAAAQFDCLCAYANKGKPLTPFLTIPLNDPREDCLEVCKDMCSLTNVTFLGLHLNNYNWSCAKH